MRKRAPRYHLSAESIQEQAKTGKPDVIGKQAERYHAARSQEKKTTKNEKMRTESNTTLPGAQKRQEKRKACGTGL